MCPSAKSTNHGTCQIFFLDLGVYGGGQELSGPVETQPRQIAHKLTRIRSKVMNRSPMDVLIDRNRIIPTDMGNRALAAHPLCQTLQKVWIVPKVRLRRCGKRLLGVFFECLHHRLYSRYERFRTTVAGESMEICRFP